MELLCGSHVGHLCILGRAGPIQPRLPNSNAARDGSQEFKSLIRDDF